MLSRITRRCFSQMSKTTVAPTRNQLFINGQYVDAKAGGKIESVDPRNEQKNFTFQSAGVEDVELAVASSRHAFDKGAWPRMSGYERSRIMNRIADELERRADEFAALETLDNGKPLKIAQFADIPLSVRHFRYFAGWCDKINGEFLSHDNYLGTFQAHTMKEPIGVAAQIIPWNFPLLMAAWKLAPALATGCTIVLKPSEKTPMTALLLGEVFNAAGLPEGVVNIIPGYGDAGMHLAQHPDVDKVAFTGSTATAMKVKAGMGIRPFTAELGGKSPLIVMPDANLDVAVTSAHNGIFFNAGQCCNAGSRVFVHSSVYDAFVEKSIKMAEARRLGNPFTDVDQGPQVDKIQFDKVMGYIDFAKKSGGEIITGGERHGSEGYFVKPTILGGLADDHKCAREEIFGPVMHLTKFDSEDEVVARANDTNYGLAAGLMTDNAHTINRMSRKLRAGTVWVNTYNIFDQSTPFGGFKDSGVGREKGQYALNNYLQTKCVIQPLAGDLGWYR